jgi:hypothetical protein
MPLVLADRIKETTTTTGTGSVTLLGPVIGFQSFSVIGNGNTTYYTIAGQGTSEWEVGVGTYTASGTTLSRDTVLASSAGAPTKTNFSGGTKDVFVTYPAKRSVYSDGTNIVPDTAAVLLPSSGGTGQTTYTDGQLLIGNTTGNTLAKATLTQGTGVTVTNGSGSITVAIGQAVATGSNVQFNSLGVGTAASGTAGEIRATNNVTAYFSDDRLKDKLGKIENALGKLCSLEGFYYEPNETAQALGYEVVREVGVSAQSMQQVLPEIVAPAPIDERYLTVRYERALPLIVEAIKELRAEVEALKKGS